MKPPRVNDWDLEEVYDFLDEKYSNPEEEFDMDYEEFSDRVVAMTSDRSNSMDQWRIEYMFEWLDGQCDTTYSETVLEGRNGEDVVKRDKYVHDIDNGGAWIKQSSKRLLENDENYTETE